MDWSLEEGRPIYAQLVERIQMQIVSGRYAPGQRLPSVRDLAAEAAVNPNTMQKAFAELERGGLIVTQRTNGRTVTEDEDRIREVRRKLAEEQIEDFWGKMRSLGFSGEEMLEWMTEKMRRIEEENHE